MKHVLERQRMHGMLCFAGQNVSWKMHGEGLPCEGCRTRSARGGLCSDGLAFHELKLEFLKDASHESVVYFISVTFTYFISSISIFERCHESFVFTSSTFSF